MQFHTLISIINDTIHSTGTPYDELTAREKNTRDAMLLVTVLAPIAGAFLSANFAPESFDWSGRRRIGTSDDRDITDPGECDQPRPRSFRHNKLAALWFLSIGIFGALQYLQSGSTTRGTFVLAIAHNQIEVLYTCLLLRMPASASVSVSMAYGFIMYPIVMFAPSMAVVYMAVAIIGGANDVLMFLLLFYGKQWILAAGAFAHVFTAISVFTCIIDNFGVLPYNLCIFLGLWAHISFTVSGVLYAREIQRCSKMHGADGGGADSTAQSGGKAGGQRTPSLSARQIDLDLERRTQCYVRNPMWRVPVRPSALIAMVSLSLVSSTLVTVFLAYWLPGADGGSPSRPAALSWVWAMFGNDPSLGRY